jgi:hypothetical protein
MATLARRVLQCHPPTSCPAIDSVTAEIGVDADGTLVVAYRILGDHARLRIPTAPLDPDRLWEHTCCELFLAPHGGDAYVEHNFSPNGQVARFDFSAYRERAASAPGAAAWTSSTIEHDALRLDARVPLPPDLVAARISITTVIEDEHGNLSYWALRHPLARPDFHHPGGFALSLTLGAVPAIVDAPP